MAEYRKEFVETLYTQIRKEIGRLNEMIVQAVAKHQESKELYLKGQVQALVHVAEAIRNADPSQVRNMENLKL